MKSFIFQRGGDIDDLFLVKAKTEKDALRRFKKYLYNLDMDLDSNTADDYVILTPEVI